MNKHNGILIILPAYNEAENIAKVILRVKEVLPSDDILVINDNSSDNTAEISLGSGAKVLSLMMQMGYGVALQTGYKYAENLGYKYILQLDADGQHEPDYLKNILSELQNGNADVVIGSRFLHAESYNPPLVRKIGMSIFSFLCSIATGQKITDVTSGFLGFKNTVLEFLTSDYFPVDYPDADAIIMMHKNGYKIKEIPVLMKANAKKTMHSGVKPFYYVFKMFLSILVTLLRKKSQ